MENSIYDGEKRKQKSVRLTEFQRRKLDHFCQLFGVGYQRVFSDMIDILYMDILEVQAGRINLTTAIHDSMQKLLDEYVQLRERKGLVPPTYVRKHPWRT